MFEPSVNQISSAYLGNPGALQQKVQQEQKANPGLPPDLRDLLALQDIQQQKAAFQRQQAMNQQNPPTVAEQLVQAVQQPAQGMPQGMSQMPQGMPQGIAQGMPQTMPQGMPRPNPGITQLPSNIGQHMAGGGIVAFAEGDDVKMPPGEEATSTAGNLFNDIKDFFQRQQAQSLEAQQRNREGNELRRKISQTTPGFFEKLTPTERSEREAQLAELTSQMKNVRSAPVDASIETPDYSGKPTRRSDYEPTSISNLPPSAVSANIARPRPTATQNVSAGPQENPLRDYVSSLSAPAAAAQPSLEQQIKQFYENSFKVSPEEAEAKRRKEHAEQVGNVDTSQYDRLMAEYENRKKQLEAPKAGMDALLEYLGQVAATPRGRTWMESGSAAARSQNELNAQRQAQQFELTKQGLEAGQKKAEILRNEKKDIFNIGKTAYDEKYKQNFEIAKQYTQTAFEAEKLAKQLTDNQLQRENAVKIANIQASTHGAPTYADRQREALVSEWMNANPGKSRLEAATAVATALQGATPELKRAQLMSNYIKEFNDLTILQKDAYSKQGINTPQQYAQMMTDLVGGKSGSAELPLPASKNDLIANQVYQTAKGAAKWDGSQFIPVTK
jgi:hypothetical protein